MYADSEPRVASGLEEIVSRGDAGALLSEIRKAVFLVAIECDCRRRAELADGLLEIADAIKTCLPGES